MAKQEKILWGFFAGILVFLYLLSSTDLIIKEKKTEIYPVSIVIGDTTDDYYVNFRKGVEQAADDYNVDISFITLFEKEDADSQMELVKRESEDGALAVILEPVDPVECMSHMDTAALGSPVIVAGELLPVDSVKAAVSIDHYEAGKKMGEAIAAEHEPELPVYIFTDNQGHSTTGVFEGLKSVLEENGFAMAVYERKSPDTFRKVIEERCIPEAVRQSWPVWMHPAQVRQPI
ncbi:MAG: substrate-binding domain-containing protein [[Clostridium] symbiosum]